MHVLHLFDRFVNSGAHSSASAISSAISLCRPEWTQSAVVFSPESGKKKVCPPWFFMQDVHVGFTALKKSAREHQSTVVLLHRIMKTPVEHMAAHVSSIGCPCVVVSHTLSTSASANKMGSSSAIIAVSKKMAKVLSACNRRRPVHVIRNFCADTSTRWSYMQSDRLTLGRVNAFNAVKHSDKFISWFRGFDFGKPATLRYVGAGKLIDSAKTTYNNSYGRNAVDFLGWIEGRDNILQEMSCWNGMLYHINEPEGTSMAVIDAMCMGMPIVTSDLPGNNELIEHGVSGLLFSNFSQAGDQCKSLANMEVASSLSEKVRLRWESECSCLVGGEKYCKVIEEHSFKSSSVVTTRVALYGGSTVSASSSVSNTLSKCESFALSKSNYMRSKWTYSDEHICLLVTCRNKSAMLGDCLESVANQTHRNISVSFVDDASSDQSRVVWHKWVERLEARGVICREHFNHSLHGYARSLAAALTMAPPKCIVAILDADDALLNNSCSILASIYERVIDATFVWTQFIYCCSKLRPQRLGFSSQPLSGKSLLDSELTLKKKHCYSHWRSFRRFAGDDEVFNTDAPSAIDKFMGYRLEEFGKGHFENMPLYLYREPGIGTMTASGGQAKSWHNIRAEAKKRRKNTSCILRGFV